jgi:hypothetical protein
MKTNLVASTGCEKGDILIGPYKANRDMKIRVSCPQDRGDNLQIEGGFELLEAGTGTYGATMAKFVDRHFENAQELIELIRQKPEAKKCTFILHKDMLRVEKPTGSLTGTESPERKQIESRTQGERAESASHKRGKEISDT